ncbi:hypothetical protein OF83DRAFT_1064497 [Amylostereum chailletii]|nr:hypothetical protein OF83DRAFT_1064497 [Amylostereum chailletii]
MSSISKSNTRRRKQSQPAQANISTDPPAPFQRKNKNTIAFILAIPALLLLLSLSLSPISWIPNFRPTFTSDLPPERIYPDPPFLVRDLPGRGKGVIATRDITRGELLIRESPLFRVPSSINTSPIDLLHSLLAPLSHAQREAFYNLSFVNMPHHLATDTEAYRAHLPLAIFQTNAVAAGSDAIGIFPRMARLNHGCSHAFNSVYSWRDDEEVLVVHALKNISAGEELLTVYFSTMCPRIERQRQLALDYAFECTCASCSLPPAQSALSDARLSQMAALYRQFSSWKNGAVTSNEAVEIARKIWRLGEEEGYHSERGRLAADAALVAAAAGDEAALVAWAQLAERWAGYELGTDSALAREMRAAVAHPQGHATWGRGRQEDVGGPGEGVV